MRIILVCCALSVAIAGTAQAANRFAAPGGSGLACTVDAPCTITNAINAAGTGDDVTLAPGTYGSIATPLTTTLGASAADVYIHAAPGHPAVIYSATSYALEATVAGDRVSDVVVHQRADNGTALYLASTARADRVIAIAESPSASALGDGCVAVDATQITDSVCLGAAAFSTGLSVSATLSGPDNVTVRNVTAINLNAGTPTNDNQGNAISVFGVAGRSAALTMINSIAIGAGHDLRVFGVSGGFASVITSHSYASNRSIASGFSSAADSLGLLTTAPLFAAPTDFHEAPGSSSLDAGVDDFANGPYDVDGVPRMLGAHTDIGAYEQRVAPGATTSAVSDVTATGATLHAVVLPNGSDATYQFQFGTTTAYGSLTAQRSVAQGTPLVEAGEGLSGLTPGTTYHVRVLVNGRGGGAMGDDVAFTTAPLATVTVPGPTPKPAAKPCTVPSVKAGSTVLAAVTKLAKAGCRLGSTTKARSKKVRKGRVIRLTIKAGTKTTNSIGVVVSRGHH
jgi:hypothetical protein